MKNFLLGLGAMFVMFGAIFMGLATISGIGYALYCLGVLEMTFGLAAWTGFVLWLKLFVGGFVTMVTGYVLIGIN